jgi:hypothetical protein
MSQKTEMSYPVDLSLSRNLISHQALELTLVLLRWSNPPLAFAIHNMLTELKAATAQNTPPILRDNRHRYAELLSRLDVQTISAIMAELNVVAQRVLASEALDPETKTIMSQLLQEWADLVEWVLLNSTVDQRQYH